jgi:hypothetical protein
MLPAITIYFLFASYSTSGNIVATLGSTVARIAAMVPADAYFTKRNCHLTANGIPTETQITG